MWPIVRHVWALFAGYLNFQTWIACGSLCRGYRSLCWSERTVTLVFRNNVVVGTKLTVLSAIFSSSIKPLIRHLRLLYMPDLYTVIRRCGPFPNHLDTLQLGDHCTTALIVPTGVPAVPKIDVQFARIGSFTRLLNFGMQQLHIRNCFISSRTAFNCPSLEVLIIEYSTVTVTDDILPWDLTATNIQHVEVRCEKTSPLGYWLSTFPSARKIKMIQLPEGASYRNRTLEHLPGARFNYMDHTDLCLRIRVSAKKP